MGYFNIWILSLQSLSCQRRRAIATSILILSERSENCIARTLLLLRPLVSRRGLLLSRLVAFYFLQLDSFRLSFSHGDTDFRETY